MTGFKEDESVFEPLWKLLEPIQSIGLTLTGFPPHLHQFRREGERLNRIQDGIDEGLITDEREIREFEEMKDEFCKRFRKAFSREAFDRESFS